MLNFYKITLTYFIIILLVWLLMEVYFVETILFITGIYTTIIVWGVVNIRSQMFIKTYNSNPICRNKVAITFDDGPDATNTPLILKLLQEYNAKATFFCIGKSIEKNPELTLSIHKQGHCIGNHSYSHNPMFPIWNSKTITNDVNQCQNSIFKITADKNIYFRPPFGVTNPLIAMALRNIDVVNIGWSIRSLDTKNESSTIVVKRITKKIQGGDIILLHDTSKHIISILTEVLEYLKHNNIQAVTISDLIHSKK